MPEPVIPLAADHAFVLQLQESRGRPETCRAGRVEHLASGEATRFITTTEFWDFVDRVLTAVTECREQGPRRDSTDRDS
jgi:hypothetical protein